MAENLTLDEFLRRLGAERGLHRKVRLLGRYWKQVQSLPPEQRERVALALGSQAVWNRLEKLFARDGTLSEGELSVKRALDSVGQADPGELRALARKMRSGEYTEVGRDLARAVGDALEEEAEAGEPRPDQPSAATAAQEAQPDRPDETAAREPGAADSETPWTPAEPHQTSAEPSGANVDRHENAGLRSESEDADGKRAPAEAVEPPEASTSFAGTASSERPPHEELPVPEPQGATEEPLPSPKQTARTQEKRRPKTPRAAAQLSAAASLAELRRLRDSPDHGARLGADGRALMLDRLRVGWARRRGLSQLIRGRSLDGVDEALRLIGKLETPVQRSWCLGDLIQHWDLDDSEAARVLDAAPSQATRRRLQRRAQRRT